MRNLLLVLFTTMPFFTFCSAAQNEANRPISVLYVTGGCCHDYEAQMDLLTEGLSNRLEIDWTIDFEADDSRDFKLSLYNDPGWHEDFDAVLYNICFADVTDVDYV